jgi:hypothetical protein
MHDDHYSFAEIVTGSHALEGVMALGIPIVAIVMGIGIGMLALVLDYRRKRDFFQLHHAERMAAIEKGLDVPPLPPELFEGRRPRTPANYLFRGLLWLLMGLSLGIAIFTSSHVMAGAVWGILPMSVGIANLLYYFLSARLAQPNVSP